MAEEMGKSSEEIFSIIAKNDVGLVQAYLSHEKIPIDIVDEHGMTPLLNAAYKGNREMCQMFLDKGADVNAGKHEHGYSSLHFAALSGNVETCQLLLSAGVKVHTTNSVGRTASQMAAFVGNHQCVAIINNFIPKEDIEYYTVPRDLEKEPKLLPTLATPLHKLIMEVNIHPVHVLMYLQSCPLMVDNLSMVAKVMDILSEKEIKRGVESNELMALKFHLLSFILRHIECQKHEIEKKKHKSEVLETIIKLFLKGRPNDNVNEGLENLLREAVRSFPHRECTSFRQLVTNLAEAKIGTYPPTMYFINSAINGQRGFQDQEPCSTCGEEKALRRCSKCKSVQYCNKDCQRLHWFTHKKVCEDLAKKFVEQEIKITEKKQGSESKENIVEVKEE